MGIRADEVYAILSKRINNGEMGGKVTPEMLDAAVDAALKAAKDYTDDAVGSIVNFDVEVVDSLPTEGANHTIYFVPNLDGTHDEYMYINDAWELIGNTTVDLTGYAKSEDIPTKTSDLTNDSGFITADVLENTDAEVINNIKLIIVEEVGPGVFEEGETAGNYGQAQFIRNIAYDIYFSVFDSSKLKKGTQFIIKGIKGYNGLYTLHNYDNMANASHSNNRFTMLSDCYNNANHLSGLFYK